MARTEHGIWCCSKCGRTVQDGARFHNRMHDGRQSYCAECASEYQREYRNRWRSKPPSPRVRRGYADPKLARMTAAFEKHFGKTDRR